jgi:hypothetical protein
MHAVDWTLVLTTLITTVGAVVSALSSRHAGRQARIAKSAAVRSVDAANSLRPPGLPTIEQPSMERETIRPRRY